MYTHNRMKTQPTRTCIGTGEKGTPERFVRFTRVKGMPVPDAPGHKNPGRGAYLLPVEGSYNAAVRKKAFARHLQTSQPPLTWPELAEQLKTLGYTLEETAPKA